MVSKSPLWNQKDLPEPPVNTYKSLTQDVDLTKLRNALHEGIKHFKAGNFLTSEAALLSRILYRMKSKFGSSKDFKLMEKLRRSLDIYFNTNMLRHLNNIFHMVPTRYEKDTYLPTKNMLNYVLVRLQGIVKLMERIYDTCIIIALELNKRFSVGHFWKLFLILFALVSRISILIKFNTKFLCELYGKLLPHSFKLQNFGKIWLPDEYVLPSDLRTWLSVQWVYEEEFIDLTFEPTNQIMNFFNLVNDEDDDDVLFCDEYILLDDEDKQIEKQFHNLSPLKETLSRNRMRGFSINDDDIGEEIGNTPTINVNTLFNSTKTDVDNTNSAGIEEQIRPTDDKNLSAYSRTQKSFELIEENEQCNRDKYLNDEHNLVITIPDTPMKEQYNPFDNSNVIVSDGIVNNESQLIKITSAEKKKPKKRKLVLSEKTVNKKLCIPKINDNTFELNGIKSNNDDDSIEKHLSDEPSLIITIPDTPMKEQYNPLESSKAIVLDDTTSNEPQMISQLKSVETTGAKKSSNKKRKKTLQPTENLSNSPEKTQQQHNKNKETVVSDSSIIFIDEEPSSLTAIAVSDAASPVLIQKSLQLNKSPSKLSKKEKKRIKNKKLSSKNKSCSSKTKKKVNKRALKFVEENGDANKGTRGVDLREESFRREENWELPILNERYDLQTINNGAALLAKSNTKKSKGKKNKKAKKKKALESLNKSSQAVQNAGKIKKKVVAKKKHEFHEVSKEKNFEMDKTKSLQFHTYLGEAQPKPKSTKNMEQKESTQEHLNVIERSAKRLKRKVLQRNSNKDANITLSQPPLYTKTSIVLKKARFNQNEILHDSPPAKSKHSKKKKSNKKTPKKKIKATVEIEAFTPKKLRSKYANFKNNAKLSGSKNKVKTK